MRVPVSRSRPPWPAGLLSSRRSCAGRRSRPGWRVRVRRHGSACCASRDRLGPGPCVTVRRRRARGGGSCGAPATVVRRRSLSCGLTTTTAPTCGRRIRAISPALPVTSNATRSVGSRLDANISTAAGVDSIRPAEQTLPAATITTSQKSRWTSIPIALNTATSSSSTMRELRWANDTDGFVLAAQPGQSQGRPLKIPGSQPISRRTACPTCVPQRAPVPVTRRYGRARTATPRSILMP